MNSRVELRLREAGVELPAAPAPAGGYTPWLVVDGWVYVSGQTARIDGKVAWHGRVGAELGLEAGRQAARLCAINLLAQLKAACDGDLDRVAQCVRLGGFVASDRGFTRQPEVIDAASSLMLLAFGTAGRHVRTTVGVWVLPSDSAVEIDAVFRLR